MGQSLNTTLAVYIAKVHELEQMIRKLSAENKKLIKQCSRGPLEVDFYSIYKDDLIDLRNKLAELEVLNVEVQIDRDNKTYKVEDILQKIGTLKNRTLVYKREIDRLSKDSETSVTDLEEFR